MRIEARAASPLQLTPLLVFGALVSVAIYLYVTTTVIGPSVLCMILASLVLFMFGSSPKTKPFLVIDDAGIYDARIGIPKIEWRDIEKVSFVSTYGNRFLILQVRDPEAYISELDGRRKERMAFHQKLGFKTFNIDVKHVSYNLMDLKKMVETRAKRSRSTTPDKFRMQF